MSGLEYARWTRGVRGWSDKAIPTAVQIPPELNGHDFVTLARSELEGRVRLRLLARAPLKEAKRLREIGAMLKVHPKTVLKWRRRFRAGGIAGLAEQPGRGAKRRLPVEQEQAQRGGGSLSGEDIRAWVAEHFEVSYSLSGLYEVLHRAGLSWVSARSKHPQHDAYADVFGSVCPARDEAVGLILPPVNTAAMAQRPPRDWLTSPC